MRTHMNIEMIGNHGANQIKDMENITYDKPSSAVSRMRTEKMGFSLDITGTVRENAAYGKEELRSAEDIAQMAGVQNVSVQSDYMVVMSNSMSDEDFAKLLEDGVDPTKIPAGQTVTNLDKIKIKMAEAGETIAGYNDDLTEEDIKAVLGNSINATKIIADTLASSDLPATSDNISEIKRTVMMAGNLAPLSDETKAYMISEKMAPTVENLYRAEYSAASTSKASDGVHFEGAATYAGSKVTESNWEALKDQAVGIIEEAGLEVDETTLSDAKWIATHEIPLTKETISAYENIKDIKLPADPKDLIAAMTVAIEKGEIPEKADLTQTKSLYVQASELVDRFMSMDDPEDLTRHRQLEEVRLVMTKEANLTLLRKGINIETQPLEELVDRLKEAEREFYAPLLEDEGKLREGYEPEEAADLDSKIDIYKQTRQVIDLIPALPARIIADKAGSDDFTLAGIARDGRALKESYDRAAQSYEQLMTAPRADMGDSIRKAFRNVDDILESLEMDTNDANRKAVRTLGYAGMMINRESVDNIRTATHAVERVINLMTPAKTLSMIREGINPLGEDIFKLEKTLSEESFEESGEKYSRFLLRMERSGQISDDEKQAFIGMYRLFDKIEKQDGRVIGNVLSSGKELTLENMLEASRSNRQTGSEFVIDDDFGRLEQLVEKGESITSQLDRAFLKFIDPAPDKDTIAEKLDRIRTAAKIAKQPEEILSIISEPVTAENILAVNALTGGMGPAYKKLFQGGREAEDDKNGRKKERLTHDDIDDVVRNLDDRESLEASYERFLEKASRIAKEEVLSSETSEDVRMYGMIYKQVGFAAALADKQSYEIPVLFEDKVTSIHLTIIHSKEEAGKVKASFESDTYGKVEASFTLSKDGVDGFVVSDSRAGVDNLKGIDDKIREGFEKENLKTSNLSYIFSAGGAADGYISDQSETRVSDRSLYRIAKAFISALG